METRGFGVNVAPAPELAASSQRWVSVTGWRTLGIRPEKRVAEPGLSFDDPPPQANGAPLPSWLPSPYDPTTFTIHVGKTQEAFYAATILSDRERDHLFGLRSRGSFQIWLNGRLVFLNPAANPEESVDETALFRARLAPGSNSVLLRVESSTPGHFLLRLCAAGRPLPAAEAKFAAARIGERAASTSGMPEGVQWFRNNQQQRYDGAEPPTAWDFEKRINVLWATPLEWSWASPVVVGDRVFVCGEPHFLICLDKKDGSVLWRREASVLELTDPPAHAQAQELWRKYEEVRLEAAEFGFDHWTRVGRLVASGESRSNAMDRIDALEKDAAERRRRWHDFLFTKIPPASFYWHSDWNGYWEGERKLDWKHAPGGNMSGHFTGYAFATPITDGKQVWVKFFTGAVACYDMDGSRKWLAKVERETSSGQCSSPVMADGKIICLAALADRAKPAPANTTRGGSVEVTIDEGADLPLVSGPNSELVALDAGTGVVAWRTPLRAAGVNNTPVVMRLTNGREDMDVVVVRGNLVVRASDGKLLASGVINAGDGSGGGGTATPVGDLHVNFCDSRGGLKPCAGHRLLMLDRDTVGVQLVWGRPYFLMGGGPSYKDGLLYGILGSTYSCGYRIYEAATGRELARTVQRDVRGIGITGRDRDVYVPTTLTERYVYLATRGWRGMEGKDDTWAPVSVLQQGVRGRYIAHNLAPGQLTSHFRPDGDRMYVRCDGGVVCFGYTGDAGRVYEAEVNARWLLSDLDVMPPRIMDAVPVAAIDSKGGKWGGGSVVFGNGALVAGPFFDTNSCAAVERLGGMLKVGATMGVSTVWTVSAQQARVHAVSDAGRTALDVAGLTGSTGGVVFVQTAFANDKERGVRLVLRIPGARAWVSGLPAVHGDRLKLAAGQHRVLVEVPLSVGESDKLILPDNIHIFKTPSFSPPAETNAVPLWVRFDESDDPQRDLADWVGDVERSRPILERAANLLRPGHPLARKAGVALGSAEAVRAR
jgi:outer membrane protein assembly factor BamB